MSEDTNGEPKSEYSDRLETIVVENKQIGDINENSNDKTDPETNLSGKGDTSEHVEIKIHEEGENNIENIKTSPANNESIPEVLINQPLCADYGSTTDTDTDTDSSSDTESDSSTVDSDSESSSEGSSDDLQDVNDDDTGCGSKPQQKDDLDLSDLPPIENLRISVPEEECQEIGVISSIVTTLVVVQAYKGTPALDIDTVLFLDMGQKSLGRIFDVLGPVSEPVYAVRFNTAEEIAENNITKGQKVYCAPKTEYTSFVFVSQLMKMKGSDASWKNNEEAPPEYQDFSDDEEEHKFKHGGKSGNSSHRPPSTDNGSRKKGKIHYGKPNYPNRTPNYRNPFALGHTRNQRYNQTPTRYPPPYPPGNYSDSYQQPYPCQYYNAQYNFQHGGTMAPPFPNYPHQQYPSYPMQQFAMPPVMPPPLATPMNPTEDPPRMQTQSRIFGTNVGNPQNG